MSELFEWFRLTCNQFCGFIEKNQIKWAVHFVNRVSTTLNLNSGQKLSVTQHAWHIEGEYFSFLSMANSVVKQIFISKKVTFMSLVVPNLTLLTHQSLECPNYRTYPLHWINGMKNEFENCNGQRDFVNNEYIFVYSSYAFHCWGLTRDTIFHLGL